MTKRLRSPSPTDRVADPHCSRSSQPKRFTTKETIDQTVVARAGSIVRLAPLPADRRAHPILAGLGVFGNTQGSGNSTHGFLLAEKVRRGLCRQFSFLVMTIGKTWTIPNYKTFVGSGVCSERAACEFRKAARKAAGRNHRFMFTMNHKFRRDEDPQETVSANADDIIVMSDEAQPQPKRASCSECESHANASVHWIYRPPLCTIRFPCPANFGSYAFQHTTLRRAEEEGLPEAVTKRARTWVVRSLNRVRFADESPKKPLVMS